MGGGNTPIGTSTSVCSVGETTTPGRFLVDWIRIRSYWMEDEATGYYIKPFAYALGFAYRTVTSQSPS